MLIKRVAQNPLPLPANCYDMRVVHTNYPADLSPEAAEELAAKLYSLGVNFVLTEGQRRHMEPPNLGIGATRNLVEACHKFGMRVVHHNTCAWINEMPEEWRNKWSQRDARTGEIAVFPGTGGQFCMNNPDFRREYFARCKDFKEQTGVDGFMTDEVEWLPNWFVCGCDVCRNSFKQETGFTLPTGEESEHWGNFDSPLWRAWITARMRWVGDFYEAFQNAILDDDVWFGCLAGGAEINMPVNWGDELEEFMRSHNIAFFEACDPDHFFQWLPDAPRMAYYTGAGVHFQTPVLSLFYPTDENDFIFAWAYMKAFGHNTWTSYGSPLTSDQTWGEYFNFERDHTAIYSRGASIADTAILFSRRTRDLYYPTQRDRFLTEWRGWCQVLTAANRPYDVILEGDLTPERLSQYKLLVLPACVCMSAQQAEAIVEFVRGGGNLIVAAEAGIWDETGTPRAEPLLKDICGVTVGKPDRITYAISAPTDSNLGSALAAKQIEEGLLGTVTDTTAEVISEARTADGGRPFLLRNSSGQGTLFTLTGRLGALSNQDRTTGSCTEPVAFDDTRVPEACELTLDLIELAHPQPWPLQAPSTDECGQMLGCLSHKLPSGFEAIVIHQINISGAVLEDGQEVKVWPDDVTYPKTEPVEVTLRTEAAPVCAYAISPDYEAEQLDAKAGEYPGIPVEFSHQDGETRLQLPVLGRYAAVVVELAD